MKHTHLFAALGSLTLALGLSEGALAQTEMSAWTATGRGGVATTFVTDYQAIGINASNLGWTSKYEGKTFTLGLLEGSYSLYSEALTKDEVRNTFIKTAKQEDLTYDEKIAAARDFTESGFAINLDVQAIGMALTTENAGGFAFGVRDRVRWFSKLSQPASEILFLGYNAPYFDQSFFTSATDTIATTNPDSINYASASVPNPMSDILDGSKLQLSWMREYSLSYGVKIAEGESVSIYAGAGIKYIQGIGYMDVQASGGQLNAYSALAPGFGVDYGSGSSLNPSSVDSSGSFSSVGSGIGFDFGVSIIANEKLKIGFAINDIGSVTWDGNVYQAKDTLLFDANDGGINSLNIFTESGDLAGDNGLFTWNGLAERKVKLPTMIRAGASYMFGEKFEAGVDFILPANEEPGNIDKAVIAVGADLKPIPWLRLSAGFITGGNYGFNLPVGLTVSIPSGSWEAGIASRDALTFFTSESPTLSLATGFLRFRF